MIKDDPTFKYGQWSHGSYQNEGGRDLRRFLFHLDHDSDISMNNIDVYYENKFDDTSF